MSPPEATIEREIRLVLGRHLPYDLRGVAIAQSAAVIDLLRRRTLHEFKPAIDGDFRRGLLALIRLAQQHHATSPAKHPSTGSPCAICTVCTSATETTSCPIAEAIALLGLIPAPSQPEQADRSARDGIEAPPEPLPPLAHTTRPCATPKHTEHRPRRDTP